MPSSLSFSYRIRDRAYVKKILSDDKSNLFTKIRSQKDFICSKEDQFKIIKKVLLKTKIPFSLDKVSTKNDGYIWNGHKLKIGNLKPSDIAHEIGHYLVAKPKDRKKPEFGLGSSLDGKAESSQSVYNSDYYELLASLLGILIEYSFNLNAKATFKAHNWDNLLEYDKFESILNDLKKLKLIDKNGKLLFLK